MPIFAGFVGGPGVLAGPSVGYLLSFPLAAALVGFLAHRSVREEHVRRRAGSTSATPDKRRGLGLKLFLAGVAGLILSHVLGIIGMMLVIARTGSVAIRTDNLHYKSDLFLNAAVIADLAFIPGDLIKAAAAALIAVAVHRAFPRMAGAVL